MAEYRLIAVDKIRADAEQVRRTFEEESLEGLARSIREVGMLQPVLVAPAGDGETYQLISGERRLRAARRLGEREIPALVVDNLAASATRIQLIENLQREDLNPVERALGIRALMEKEGLSKAAAAARLGVPRTTLTDWLDVLDLEPRFQAALVDHFMERDSPLTVSHVAEAKALAARLGSPQMASVLLDAVLEYRLSKAEVRQVAQMVRSSTDLSIAEAVRRVLAARQRQGSAAAPAREGAGHGRAVDGAGETLSEGASEPSADGTTAVRFDRLMTAMGRLRATLATLIGAGLLYQLSAEQRSQLVEYLSSIRRWVDDVIQFTREADDPQLATERRRRMLLEARRRRRRRGRREGLARTAGDGHGA